MTILRFLNVQGIAGIAVSLSLAVLFVVQKADASHWKEQCGHFERLYRDEQATLATTVANYRSASAAAHAADQATIARVTAEQRAINERTDHDLETRLAAARAAAERLRVESRTAGDPRASGDARVPSLPASTHGFAQDSDENRLPASDALAATEQAIQLDELIKWVRAQAQVEPNRHQK